MSNLALESTFAGCRIEGVAGSGGMGVVYKATQLPIGRAVALKVVAPEKAGDSTLHARFEREARLAATIHHPNVIPVYGSGEQDGSLYLVMRWVEGTDLQALIQQTGGLEPRRAAAIVSQASAGLQAAHSAGLVHRDVKPANILITHENGSEHAYLGDFGLTLELSANTRLTQSGELLGTVEFMAPEQFEASDIDARTDVYALGCVLHAALTGRPPFPGRTLPATMRAHLSEPPPRPSETPGVPAAFDQVIARALAKRPVDRYATAAELAEATRSAADTQATSNGDAMPTVSIPKPTIALPDAAPMPTARLNQPGRSLRARISVFVGALLALAAGIVALLLIGAEQAASGPLTKSEVRDTAQSFALAYGREDDDALADLLAEDVTRVTPGDRQRGRRTVLREYRRQFAGQATKGYELDELDVSSGRAGRARASYVAARSGRSPITGHIVFGVRRVDGDPKIGLIAVTPDR